MAILDTMRAGFTGFMQKGMSAGKSKERIVYICELCKEAGRSVQYNQFCALSKHYQQAHNKLLLKEGSVRCREDNCNFHVNSYSCPTVFKSVNKTFIYLFYSSHGN